MSPHDYLWHGVTALALLLFSAFFSASEAALFSLNQLAIRRLVHRHPHRGRSVAVLLSRPRQLLTTILLGNNIVNIGLGALATTMALRHWGPAGVPYALGGTLLSIMFFGEMLPKMLGVHRAEFVAPQVAYPLRGVEWLSHPVRVVLRWVTDILLTLLLGRSAPKDPYITQEEFRSLIDASQQDGILNPSERDMIHSCLDLAHIEVRQIMTPRVDMVMADADWPREKAVELFQRIKHKRVPVYEKTPDNIIGTINVRYFLLGDGPLRAYLREPYFAPATMKADLLLKELQAAKRQIAIVVDEYGQVAGLVTIEDIVEEIFGEIEGEYVNKEILFEKIGPGSYRIKGKMKILDLNEQLSLSLPTETAETLAGFFLARVGRFPRPGQSFMYQNARFTATQVTRTTVAEVIVSFEPEP